MSRCRLAPSRLEIAAILSANAGFLDGVTFVGHGHVFAGAMTGNMVLLGVHAVTDGKVAAYLAPIFAYVAGVLAANIAAREVVCRRPYLIALAAQSLLLLGLAFTNGTLADMALVTLITVGTAMQNASFRNIGTRTYNSIIMTGNLQAFSNAFASSMLPPNFSKLREAAELGCVIAAFILGAAGGALATPHLGLHALLVPASFLAVAWLLLLPSPTITRPGFGTSVKW